MRFFRCETSPAVRAALEPKMRLFLSADIVGSTAYKQRQPESDKWFRVVVRFYRDAELHFLSQWRACAGCELVESTREHLFGNEPPELWKLIGDEVVFTKQVERPWQVAICIHVWMEALALLRAELRKADGSLDVKSTTWLADFPLRNREVGLRVLPAPLDEPEDLAVANHLRLAAYYAKETGFARDFVGPSIDTGFRLGAFATPRQMAISVELAHVLSGVHGEVEEARPPSTQGVRYQAPSIFYDGAEPLRGVMGGVPYPRFWIDVGTERLHQTEDRLLDRRPAQMDNVNRFTSAFIQQYPDQFCAGLPWWVPHVPLAYNTYCDSLFEQIRDEERKLLAAEASEKIRLSAGEISDSELTTEGFDPDLETGPDPLSSELGDTCKSEMIETHELPVT